MCEYIVMRIDDIEKIIIPFFEKYPIKGSKYLNFIDFKIAAEITLNNEHLNKNKLGLEKILKLKQQMTDRTNLKDNTD